MPTDPRTFEPTLGPQGDHIHVIARLREEVHGGQPWASAFLGPTARVRHTLAGFRSVALRCPPGALAELEARSEVAALLPDLRVRGLLDRAAERSSVPPLWEEGFTGKGVRLAVLDSGIDRGHPDFEGRLAGLEDFTGCGVRDDVGHGTYVASAAAGSGEASRGRYRGAAPAAALLVARVLDSHGQGRMSDVMAGLMWAQAREARVVVLALGTEAAGSAGDALCQAVDQVAASGVIVCAAAVGAAGGLVSPATAARALRVYAYDPAGDLPGESGPAPEAGAELAAPGTGVVAARAYGTQAGRPAGEQYVEGSGASAAAAHVAGVCALLLEAVPGVPPELLADALRLGGRAVAGGRRAVSALAALAELRELARHR
ncbi:MAG TPA: S8 family serine peptidase [Candidatus Saccharimonadales bacterium]|nr:S8 family serine peptidase [Candidatus Saccharimonadales bacterium]